MMDAFHNLNRILVVLKRRTSLFFLFFLAEANRQVRSPGSNADILDTNVTREGVLVMILLM